MKQLAGLAVLLAIGYLASDDPPEQVNRFEVRVVDVIDGDTIDVCPVNTQFRLRLANADTWESRRVRRLGEGAISDAELAKGKLAKEATEDLLCKGPVYVETKPGAHGEPVLRDAFGRTLGRVTVHRLDDNTNVDLGQWLKANGHTR